MQWLWILSLSPPPLIALLVSADEPTRRLGRALAPYAPLPMLVMALLAPVDEFSEVSWWMLGSVLGVDATGQVFLLLITALWTVAGFYARAYVRDDPRQDRFWLFFLLAMLGNIGLVVSFDIAGFYLFFAVMTFASFGLVVHHDDAFAHFASMIYIVLAIVGEALLLLGVLQLADALGQWTLHDAPSERLVDHPARGTIMLLLLGGFGVKAGALILHVWLPLAHPAAPTPASAVLSGAMIKAGLLGWLRFLPGGEAAFDAIGALVVALGVAAAFYGVLVGLAQLNPKSNLAYSSVSQMGFMTAGLGLGLAAPELWPTALLVVSLYALHHGLAKGALFLGVGVVQYAVRTRLEAAALYAGLLIAALSLAGLPLTSGYFAKALLKDLGAELPHAWMRWVELSLPLAAVGTTLLMGRFVWLIRRERCGAEKPYEAHHHKPGLWLPWAITLAGVVGLTWAAPLWYALDAAPPGFEGRKLWAGFWPVGLGLLVLMIAGWRRWLDFERELVPAGDVLYPVLAMIRPLLRGWRGIVVPASTELRERLFWMRNRAILKTGRWVGIGEAIMVRWGTGGLMFLALILMIAVVVAVFQ